MDKVKTLESALSAYLQKELDGNKKKYSVEDALEKALDNTTIEHGGQPWQGDDPDTRVESEWFDG